MKPYGYMNPAQELLRITIFVKIREGYGTYLEIASLLLNVTEI